MPIWEIKYEPEQLFVFDRWGHFIGVTYSAVEPQKNIEAIAYDIIQQALAEIATALNSEARHG